MIKIRCKYCNKVKSIEDIKFFGGEPACKECIEEKKVIHKLGIHKGNFDTLSDL